jgi:hypothetical protein
MNIYHVTWVQFKNTYNAVIVAKNEDDARAMIFDGKDTIKMIGLACDGVEAGIIACEEV